ncbi:phage tail protein [Emcibacter sp.]|uniref:phage tail-collar fiber domain-containing protein n=1 Tax=Emcibacter sp. TaxID=1979954 RepID=UPI002AA79D73|nr:phage tail protein [Emcibacter sp.]
MPVIEAIITDAGRQAANDAAENGFSVEITHFAIGTGYTAPDASLTALVTPLKNLTVDPGAEIQPHVAHLTSIDSSEDAYTVTEFGLLLSDGTLFAYYAAGGATIADKTAYTQFPIALDVVLDTLTPGSVTVSGNTGFSLPDASETTPGQVQMATSAETVLFAIDYKAVSPKSLQAALQWDYIQGKPAQYSVEAHIHDASDITSGTLNKDRLPTASTTAKGALEIATNTETLAGTLSNRIVTPAGLKYVFKWENLQNIPTGVSRINTLSVSYGSVDIQGSANGYAGIHFTAAGRILMVSATVQGFYTGDAWQWYFSNGVLREGKVPWGQLIEVPNASTTVKGPVELATAAETILGQDATRAVTPAALIALLDLIVPIGFVAEYYGNPANLPSNWQICDGTNGTPNTLNKVTVGAGGAYSLGQSVGADSKNTGSGGTHNHTGSISVTIGGTTLTVNQMPSHRHQLDGRTDGSGGILNIDNSSGTLRYDYTGYEGGSQSHNHSASGSVTINNGGAHTHSVDVRQASIALYKIMRVA